MISHFTGAHLNYQPVLNKMCEFRPQVYNFINISDYMGDKNKTKISSCLEMNKVQGEAFKKMVAGGLRGWS